MRRRVGLLACVLPMLAVGWALPAIAQDAAATATPAKTGPEAIAPADIPLRADIDERFAQEVVQRTKGQDPAAKLQTSLDALGQSVRDEGQHFRRDELRLLSITRLESLERHWKFYGNQLEEWRRDLKQASGPYTEDAAELSRRRASWDATREAAQSTELAPALSNRVQTLLAQITLAEQAVSGPIEKQIRLSRQANTIEGSIVAGQKAVAAAIAYNDRRLVQIDSPPLWELWDDPRPSDSALKSMLAGMEVERRFLDEYTSANARYLRNLHAVGLLLLPLLVWLSFRSRRVVSDDPEIQAATRVGAEALGIEQDVGQIAPGYSADIIAVTADPLASVESLGAVEFVMKQGVVYKQ
jgi:hypothetical protein